MHIAKKLMILQRGNMSNQLIAVARSPAKRKSKTWTRESTGNLSADDCMKKLTAEGSTTKNIFRVESKVANDFTTLDSIVQPCFAHFVIIPTRRFLNANASTSVMIRQNRKTARPVTLYSRVSHHNG